MLFFTVFYQEVCALTLNKPSLSRVQTVGFTSDPLFLLHGKAYVIIMDDLKITTYAWWLSRAILKTQIKHGDLQQYKANTALYEMPS